MSQANGNSGVPVNGGINMGPNQVALKLKINQLLNNNNPKEVIEA